MSDYLKLFDLHENELFYYGSNLRVWYKVIKVLKDNSGVYGVVYESLYTKKIFVETNNAYVTVFRNGKHVYLKD